MDQNFPLNNFFNPADPKIKNNNNINYLSQKELASTQENSSVFSEPELEAITQEVLAILRPQLGQEKFSAYFEGAFQVKSIARSDVEFIVPSLFTKKMITEYYLTDLSAAIETVLGKEYNVILSTVSSPVVFDKPNTEIKEDFSYKINKATSVKEMTFSINDLKPLSEDLQVEVEGKVFDKIESTSLFGKSIDRKKKFDNFVVGPSNNLAHASAVAVSRKPGKIYSSLYIHGNSGLGKTHLLHAVANKISEEFPSQRIYITTANEFMSEMISAIKEQDIQSFRKKYSELIDVLMIDDIHELKNRQGTQNEFFHVFNELQRKNKQLIFTSDKDPKEIIGIEERIKTRLSSALVVEIQQPDFETRIAILKRKAIEEDIYLPDDVVNLIASCIKSNIRELEGSLIKLGAYSSVFNVDIDLDTAKEQLKLNEEDEMKTVNMETITKTVSNFYKIPVPDIRSKVRSKDITLARHVAMYFSYYIGKVSLAIIGEYFGKRDHTSVMHGVNKIKKMQKDDEAFSQTMYEIESLL